MISIKKTKILAICLTIIAALSISITALAAAEPTQDSATTTITEKSQQSGDNAASDGTATADKPAADPDRQGTESRQGGVRVSASEIAADILGKTKDEVKAEVEAGTSLYAQLTAAGKIKEFKTSYLQAWTDTLTQAVTDGTLTQAQADEQLASVQEKVDAFSEDSPLSPSGSSNQEKSATDGESNSRSSKKGGRGANVLSVAADVLGITEDEVRESVQEGKVGDLLTAQGKVDEFKTAYLAETKSNLEAAVAEGTMTQEEADTSNASAEQKMASYDGTTHLCGKSDHSGMFGERAQKTESTQDAA